MATKTRLNPRSLIYRFLISSNGFDIEGREELWDCTTCATCFTRCPKEVNPMAAIVALRAAFVERGKVHGNVKNALESVFMNGNPLTMPRKERGVWASGLSVKAMAEGAEYLYFVGCSPSYDPVAQKTARAVVHLMQKAGVDFGILGEQESCCGSEVKRLGEEGLFEMIVEEQTQMLQNLGVSKIFTTSPQCFNVFKNDYPKNDVQVMHYTQLLARLVESGALQFGGSVEKTVTYHDPCYLGRHNGIFDEPRRVLTSIPGVKLVEMDRSREKSLCCEGGGGRMWVEGTNPRERLSQVRVREALETGASVLATACPFCLLMLDEAAKQLGVTDRIQVMDIAVLAQQAL